MTFHRLFIGIGFSDALKTQYETWSRKIRKTADRKETSIRWTPPENLHVTLVFLGETEEEKIPRIQQSLQNAANQTPPFSLKIRNIGAFPSEEHARVLWLGVQRSQALLDLQSQLESELAWTGLLAQEHGYTPHMTIGRLRNPKSCRDLLSPFQSVDFDKQQVNEIYLYKSVQAGPFPVYEKLALFRLEKKIEMDLFQGEEK